MHKYLLLLIVLMWAYMVMTSAQPHCDPLTQYERDGRCCIKCGPGTRMLSSSTCEEPQCKECGEMEYQDTHTTDNKCKIQKYCDQNKNFKVPVHESKTKRTTCMCKDGFHCSSEACLTCVPHRNCTPGSGAQSIGNHTHDTVCKKCPEGEFSSENSWKSVCKQWTVCKEGYYIKEEGSDISDNQCALEIRAHIIPIVIVVAVIAIVLIGIIVYCQRRGKQAKYNMKARHCVETCLGQEKTPQREVMEAKEDELRTPEENEIDQFLLPDSQRTVNGNYVAQENGKTCIVSRQESQPIPFESV